ncbi:MAG TPA: putative sugar nucleotidyl transferase, partial [Rhodothermales bacterium]|nr:putative sugar nucleotidyl transferase [Rhodothermales bacterium]
MYLCLFEDDQVDHLLPLTATRGVYDLRLGLRTLLETTCDAFGNPPTVLHARRLVAAITAQENDLLTNRIPDGLDVLFVNGRYLAEDGVVLDRLRQAARDSEPARVFVQGDDLIAAWVPDASNDLIQTEALSRATFDNLPEEKLDGARLIGRLWDVLDELPRALVRDYTAKAPHFNIYERPGTAIHDSVIFVEGEQVFIAPGATVQPGAILNASNGPIYLDENAVVMERAVVRGPMYLGRKAELKVGADVQNAAIGTWSKVGGEVHDSVVHSFSNKAHPGFLGHSYLGRWCNLGADTNTSNLKNDYSEVTLYDAVAEDFVPSRQQFLGLIMGDHSK